MTAKWSGVLPSALGTFSVRLHKTITLNHIGTLRHTVEPHGNYTAKVNHNTHRQCTRYIYICIVSRLGSLQSQKHSGLNITCTSKYGWFTLKNQEW